MIFDIVEAVFIIQRTV